MNDEQELESACATTPEDIAKVFFVMLFERYTEYIAPMKEIVKEMGK